MTEIEYLESRIHEDREECRKLRAKEQNQKAAKELRAIYQSLVDEGFAEDEAFDIFILMVKKAWESA